VSYDKIDALLHLPSDCQNGVLVNRTNTGCPFCSTQQCNPPAVRSTAQCMLKRMPVHEHLVSSMLGEKKFNSMPVEIQISGFRLVCMCCTGSSFARHNNLRQD
jgi:hypothetical protein